MKNFGLIRAIYVRKPLAIQALFDNIFLVITKANGELCAKFVINISTVLHLNSIPVDVTGFELITFVTFVIMIFFRKLRCCIIKLESINE